MVSDPRWWTPIEDDVYNEAGEVLLHFREARASLVREFVVFPHSAPDLVNAAAEQPLLFQVMEKGIETPRADVVAKIVERLT